MTRHVDAVALARYRDGDLSQRHAARVSAHLAGCTRCGDLSSELAGVTALLASAQVPPIPDYLAARIQDTLATEAARRLAADPGTEPGRRDLPVRAPGPRRGGRLPRLTSPIALRALAATGVVAVLAGGGYELIAHGSGASSGSSASSANAAGRAAPGGLGGEHRAARPEFGPSSLGPLLSYGRPGHLGSFVPVTTGTDFGPASLAAQAGSTLSQVRGARAAPVPGSTSGLMNPGAAPAPSASSARQFSGIPVPRLEACVTRIAAGSPVLLVDVARYQGRPATVIVTGPAGSAGQQVWVVGSACSSSRGDVLAHQSMPGG